MHCTPVGGSHLPGKEDSAGSPKRPDMVGRKTERVTKLFERGRARETKEGTLPPSKSRQTHRREKSQSSLSKLGLNSPGVRFRHCDVCTMGDSMKQRSKHVSLVHGPVCPSGTAGPSLPSPGRPYMMGSWFLETAGGSKSGWKSIIPFLATTNARNAREGVSKFQKSDLFLLPKNAMAAAKNPVRTAAPVATSLAVALSTNFCAIERGASFIKNFTESLLMVMSWFLYAADTPHEIIDQSQKPVSGTPFLNNPFLWERKLPT
jgi:hypothetical protein